MRETHDDVRRRVRDELADRAGAAVLQVTGPLGVGKSRLVRELVREAAEGVGGLVVLDGVDRAEQAAAALALADRAGARLLVVGRRPLQAWPGWGGRPVRGFRLGPWPNAEVRRLGRSFGIADPAHLDLVVDLAGGLPFVADALCRFVSEAVHSDPETPSIALGALADLASQAIVARLRSEWEEGPAEPSGEGLAEVPADEPPTELATALPAEPPTDTLHVLAVLGGADADLLAAAGIPAAEFDRVSTLSIVDADRLGRTVAEPFRTVFDLAYRWRHPMAAEAVLAKAAAHRRRQIAGTRDAAVRADLSDRVMRTAAHPRIRRAFFPPSAAAFQARPATADADDEREVVRLVRQWACMEGLERQRADRMLEAWMTSATPDSTCCSTPRAGP
ncbi:hypothetical protein ACFQ9X_42360 [Catenulispora yoronensis]